MMKILIGSDKSGFNLKETMKLFLAERGYEIEDCGTKMIDMAIPYYEVASAAAQKIQAGEYEKAILICGTGAGMAVVANKFKGVYAVACESLYSAEKARAINDANIMTLGGWIVAEEMGCRMAEKFLETDFTENLEEWRKEFLKNAKEKVAYMEKETFKS